MVSVKGSGIIGFGLWVLVLGVSISAARASIIDVNSNTIGIGEFNVEGGGSDEPDVAIAASLGCRRYGLRVGIVLQHRLQHVRCINGHLYPDRITLRPLWATLR